MNQRNRTIRIPLLALAALVLPSVFVDSSVADAAKDTQKSRGAVTAVAPASITMDDGTGHEVTIRTAQDYSDRIPPGSHVTAWHHLQGGTDTLERIEYPLEFSPARPADFIPRVKKAILLPSSNAGDAAAVYTEIEHLLESQFHWVIAHRMLAEEIRRRAMKASDARAGMDAPGIETMPAALRPAEPELIQRIAEETRADAVLEVRVEYLLLKIKSHTAEWDGQRETFGSKGSRVASAMTLRPARGQMPAATVVLKLFDPKGRLLWSSRRGFRLLSVQVSGGQLVDRPLPEAAQDAAFTAGWLNQVFASWDNPGFKAPAATVID